MNYWLLIIPLLTALTGWGCIRLAAYLVFFPRSPKNILGFKLQGLVPRYWPQIASRAGELAASSFSVFPALEQQLNDPGSFAKLKPLIEEHIDDFLRNKLKEQMPMIGMLIGDKTIATLKTIFIKEIEELFPRVIGQFAGNLKNDLDIKQLVSNKLAAVPAAKWEALFQQQLRKPLNKAAMTGFVLGLLTGLVQLGILLCFQ